MVTLNIETEKEVSKKIIIDLDNNDIESLKKIQLRDYHRDREFSGRTEITLGTPDKESGDLMLGLLTKITGNDFKDYWWLH